MRRALSIDDVPATPSAPPAAAPLLAPSPPFAIGEGDYGAGALDGIVRLPAEWVFAYGSLIWHPDFEFSERHRVRIHGYHRAFCISSTRYRGTPELPGVVLGLDRGGSCHGVVYRMKPGQEREIIERLYQREMPNHVYTPRMLPVRLPGERRIEAIAFVARRDHPSYLRLSRDELLRRLSSCRGGRGPNRDYAINTWHALREWGIEDAGLAAVARDLEALDCSAQEAAPGTSAALPAPLPAQR
jgi:glutathione-specific gamma-glutamylcyclotransferase